MGLFGLYTNPVLHFVVKLIEVKKNKNNKWTYIKTLDFNMC